MKEEIPYSEDSISIIGDVVLHQSEDIANFIWVAEFMTGCIMDVVWLLFTISLQEMSKVMDGGKIREETPWKLIWRP